MPERIHKLQSILEELERELQTLDSSDDETRQALADAVDDLHAKLNRSDTEHLASPGMITRLQEAEELFQVSHPNISGIVVRIIDALGQLGI